jgi:hypothetical protein
MNRILYSLALFAMGIIACWAFFSGMAQTQAERELATMTKIERIEGI